MVRSRILCIFALIILSFSLVSTDEGQLKKDMERLKDICFREITSLKHYIRGPMVEILFRALEETYENEIVREAHIKHRRVMEESLENVVNEMKNLSAKVEELSNKLSNLKSVDTGVEDTLNNRRTPLNSYLELIANKVEVMEGNLITSQNVTSDDQNFNSSVQMIFNNGDGLNSTSLYSPQKFKSFMQGLIVETWSDDGGSGSEVVTISLPSLQQNVVQRHIQGIFGIAFDWNSRKVYWVHGSDSIKMANPDGTAAKDFIQGNAQGLAVDSISGNIYYADVRAHHIRVCSREGEKCSVLATNQANVWNIALIPSKSFMFWTNKNSMKRANMDGTNASDIISERVGRLCVDEDSERLYWTDSTYKHIFSSDWEGNDRRVLLNDTNADLQGIAVHGDTVYFGSRAGKVVKSVNKYGGNPVVIAKTNGRITRIALYGSKTHFQENPCASSPCSHLCVPKLDSFACLCPEGEQLQRDGTTCL